MNTLRNIMAFPLHGPEMLPLRIFGKALRAVTLTSYRLAVYTENKLILACLTDHDEPDVTIDCTDPENLFAVLAFVFLHSAPVQDVAQAAAGTAEDFERAVEAFGESVAARDCTAQITVRGDQVAAIRDFTALELPELKTRANAS